ncbi:haloacid dehalogenase-like hydrolase [Roseomonas terrae]|uniref:Haloacid dehalogenase-like hydrolase n=1 Tax=Neoroseomonas terrae TaxID=424799 RepID=A0ABS5EL94_9PROT|nr:HAD family hydrolase [Neoroseomonas terrae]MBR0651773.1 haloacid dehalogenase-like hydrolase [Neoroseomonas terrae]
MSTLPLLSRRGLSGMMLAALSARATAAQAGDDPLPSWRDGERKRAILDFLAATTTEGDAGFVPPGDRLAVFDNDGTLWVEQPMYTQLAFALDRVHALAPQHPEWQTQEPFRSVLAHDREGLSRAGTRGLVEIVKATHAGMSPDEFHVIVEDWLRQARHPRFGRPYTELIYQPMLEVLALFRARGFRTCICSGGTAEFMRPWTERVYGIPPGNVVGTTFQMSFENGRLLRLPEMDLINDGPGKPVGMSRFLGGLPQAAFGNSDGDYEMLQVVTAGPGRRLGMIVHHDDALREYAYDRQSHFGRLDRALNDAARRGWHLISMADDWSNVFPA